VRAGVNLAHTAAENPKQLSDLETGELNGNFGILLINPGREGRRRDTKVTSHHQSCHVKSTQALGQNTACGIGNDQRLSAAGCALTAPLRMPYSQNIRGPRYGAIDNEIPGTIFRVQKIVLCSLGFRIHDGM
jgi:hypothetical protein